MNLNRKKAPGRLTRAIVTLATRTGNKLQAFSENYGATRVAGVKDFETPAQYEGQMRFSERTIITVETERLLIVRKERFAKEK